MYVPFCKVTFLRMTSAPSSRNRLSIIQVGIWHTPSSAENSRTPQYDFFAIYGLLIINIIGYEIFRRASSWSAELGIMILLPLLSSGFPMKAGEYTLNP